MIVKKTLFFKNFSLFFRRLKPRASVRLKTFRKKKQNKLKISDFHSILWNNKSL